MRRIRPNERQRLSQYILELARLAGADSDPVAWAIFKRKTENTNPRVLRRIVESGVLTA